MQKIVSANEKRSFNDRSPSLKELAGFGAVVLEGTGTTVALLIEATSGASNGEMIATLAVGALTMAGTGVLAIRKRPIN